MPKQFSEQEVIERIAAMVAERNLELFDTTSHLLEQLAPAFFGERGYSEPNDFAIVARIDAQFGSLDSPLNRLHHRDSLI